MSGVCNFNQSNISYTKVHTCNGLCGRWGCLCCVVSLLQFMNGVGKCWAGSM